LSELRTDRDPVPDPREVFSGFSAKCMGTYSQGLHRCDCASGNRMRILADWALNATTLAEPTSLAIISAESVPLNVEKPRA